MRNINRCLLFAKNNFKSIRKANKFYFHSQEQNQNIKTEDFHDRTRYILDILHNEHALQSNYLPHVENIVQITESNSMKILEQDIKSINNLFISLGLSNIHSLIDLEDKKLNRIILGRSVYI